MAYLDHVGDIFFGTYTHCHYEADVYAFQIVGSTAKSPICRAVPILKGRPTSGTWTAQIDAAWLARNPLPEEPLRKTSGEFRAYRIVKDSVGRHPWMIVPKTRKDYSRGCIHIQLFTFEEAMAKRETGAFCESSW